MVFYRVRRINGRYYLIKEWYDSVERKKKTVSLGSCEHIDSLLSSMDMRKTSAEEFLKRILGHRLFTVLDFLREKLEKKDLAEVIEHLLEHYLREEKNDNNNIEMRKTIEKIMRQSVEEREIEEFRKWCIEKGTSEKTCEQYTEYLRKPFEKENKWSILAWKAFFKFKGLEDEWKKLKTKQSRPDLRIPTDEEVLNTLKVACLSSEELCLVYRLLIESGARLSEIIKMLNEYDPTRLKDHKGFYTYALAHMRGRKYSFYIFSITKPRPFKSSENWVSNWAAKNKMVNPKYVRKWVATKMLGIGIPSEIVNFIQGRTPTSILEKNYLNLYTLSLQYYPKYIELLKKMNL